MEVAGRSFGIKVGCIVGGDEAALVGNSVGIRLIIVVG